MASVKKKAKRLKAHLVFLDESGFSLIPSVRRTWALRGQTPLLTIAGSWSKISAISAVTVSPRRRRFGLYTRFHQGKNIRSAEVAAFLKHLLKHLRGAVVLLWDGGRPHQGRVVKKFLEKHPRLQVSRFPAYAPELNPDEWVWNHLKRSLANSAPKDLPHLRRLLISPVRKLKGSQTLLRSCLHASDLSWP